MELDSEDGAVHVLVEGRLGASLPAPTVYQSMAEASAFCGAGSSGYSATRRAGTYDGLELRSLTGRVKPLDIITIESSFFDNPAVFPKGSARFDCALIMRDIRHEWLSREALCSWESN